MALPVLRPVSKEDPRPTHRSLSVIEKAYDTSEQALVEWNKDRSLVKQPAELKSCVVAAIQSADNDAYLAARCLEEAFGFHSDYPLVVILQGIIVRIPVKLPQVIREWVIRTQLRFPAKAGDLIVFRDKWRHLRTGRVHSVKMTDATALVDFQNSDRSESILAENVVENRTTGETPTTPGTHIPLTLTNVIEFPK